MLVSRSQMRDPVATSRNPTIKLIIIQKEYNYESDTKRKKPKYKKKHSKEYNEFRKKNVSRLPS